MDNESVVGNDGKRFEVHCLVCYKSVWVEQLPQRCVQCGSSVLMVEQHAPSDRSRNESDRLHKG